MPARKDRTGLCQLPKGHGHQEGCIGLIRRGTSNASLRRPISAILLDAVLTCRRYHEKTAIEGAPADRHAASRVGRWSDRSPGGPYRCQGIQAHWGCSTSCHIHLEVSALDNDISQAHRPKIEERLLDLLGTKEEVRRTTAAMWELRTTWALLPRPFKPCTSLFNDESARTK